MFFHNQLLPASVTTASSRRLLALPSSSVHHVLNLLARETMRAVIALPCVRNVCVCLQRVCVQSSCWAAIVTCHLPPKPLTGHTTPRYSFSVFLSKPPSAVLLFPPCFSLSLSSVAVSRLSLARCTRCPVCPL